MKRYLLCLLFLVFGLVSCDSQHSETDVKEYGHWEKISVHYTEIELNWEADYFVHDGLKIDIPETWLGDEKEDFDNYNKHDLVYQYQKKTDVLYNGDTKTQVKFDDLDHEKPEEVSEYFSINVTLLDLDTKILIQDELKNDYYFNQEYNNFCYFKIAKNDIGQLKGGAFNEIRLKLDVLKHVDNTKSFKVQVEDGVTDVGYYDEVDIYNNPDYVKNK